MYRTSIVDGNPFSALCLAGTPILGVAHRVGCDGGLCCTVSPDLPAGLIVDPTSRPPSGLPTVSQTAALHSYAADPKPASLTLRITVEQVALMNRSAVVNVVRRRHGRSLSVIQGLELRSRRLGNRRRACCSAGGTPAGLQLPVLSSVVLISGCPGNEQRTSALRRRAHYQNELCFIRGSIQKTCKEPFEDLVAFFQDRSN